jgi:hypothetical protein
MDFRKLNRAAMAAVVFSVGVGSGLAQSSNGALVGVVRDTTGAVVPNAPVSATNEGTGVVYKGVANGAGEYRISNLPNGTYDLSTTAPGFAPKQIKGIGVNANGVQTQDLALSVSSQATTVEVSSEASVAIDTTTAQIGTTFSMKEVEDLPSAAVGLGVLNLSLEAPGVVSSGGLGAGTGPAVSGQRPRNNNFEIDGIDNNSKSVTGPLLYVPNDAVQEFTLLQNVYSSQYGHSTGGQFNSVIVSGTNSVHGRVYEFFQNRNLNAVSSTQGITDQTAKNPATGNAAGPHFNPRYDFNRYGGQLGGPIVKNKLFAFSNYERQTLGQSVPPTNFCTPTAAGLALLKTLAFASTTNLGVIEQYYPAAAAQAAVGGGSSCTDSKLSPLGATIAVSPTGSGVTTAIPVGASSFSPASFYNHDVSTSSLDYTISSKDTLRVRYVYNREDGIDTSALFPVFYQSTPARYHLANISEIHLFTPNLSNELRLGYTRLASSTPVPNITFPGLTVFPSLYFYDLGKASTLGPDPNGPQASTSGLYDLVESLTWVKGKHTINVGGEGRKYISPQQFVQRVRGDYEYSTLNLFLNDISPDQVGQRNATPPGVSSTYYGDQSSIYLYGNDDFRVTPKLTLNLGLRWEFTSLPASEKLQSLNIAASVPGLISFSQPTPQKTNFMPRIGVAYAPNEDTSIRAAFGINYDVLYDNIGLTVSPPQFQTTENVTLSAGTPNFLANGGLPANATFPTLAAQRAATTGYIPNQILPYSEQWTLGVQHVFHHDYTAEIRYVGTRGVHLDVQDQLNVQSPVTATNQLPTSFTGGGVAPNGTQTLAALEANQANGAPYYRNPAFYAGGLTSTITTYEPFGGSNYNGLQTQLTRRFQKGLLINASYTYSRTFDDSTADFNSTTLNPRRAEDTNNFHAEYSRSDLDHPNRFTLVALYDVPFFKNSNFLLKNLVGNLELAPVYTFQSPQYTTVQSVADSNLNNDSAGDRTFINPNGVKGTGTGVVALVNTTIACPATTTTTGVANGTSTVVKRCAANTIGYTTGSIAGTVFTPNTTAYYVQGGPGTLPTAGRNTLATGRENNLDLTATKRFSYRERYRMEFQVQAFNVLNHSQYLPGSLNTVNSISSTGTGAGNFINVSAPQFNQKQLDFSNNARTMQLAAKFIF